MNDEAQAGILQRKEGSVVILSPMGDVDSSVSPVLERITRARLKDGDLLLAIDLGQADVVTSLGLSVLLRLDKAAAKAGGKLVLFGLTPGVREILEKTRLETVLVVSSDRDQAFRTLLSGE